MSGDEVNIAVGVAVALLVLVVFALYALVDAVRGVGRSIDRLRDEVEAARYALRSTPSGPWFGGGSISAWPGATAPPFRVFGTNPPPTDADVEAARRKMGEAGLGIGFSGGSVGAPRPPTGESRWSWTQPACHRCWNERNPERPSDADKSPGEAEHCCYCAAATCSGIYVRVDPATVAYPSRKKDS